MQVRSVLSGLFGLHRLVAMGTLLGLVVITAVDVVGRVLFNAPLGFAYELVGILLGFAVYSGLVSTNWNREHIQIDILASRLAMFSRFERIRKGMTWILEMIFFSILAIYIFKQMAALMMWKETFLFLPMEKWLPLSVFGVFASVAVLALALSVVPQLKSRGGDAE